jgi:hypothetical protein
MAKKTKTTLVILDENEQSQAKQIDLSVKQVVTGRPVSVSDAGTTFETDDDKKDKYFIPTDERISKALNFVLDDTSTPNVTVLSEKALIEITCKGDGKIKIALPEYDE